MKTLLKNARILKMDGSDIFFGDIVVDGCRIAYIGPDGEKYGPFRKIRDIKGNVLMPGFKNAHTHSGMTFLRSKSDDQALNDWLFKTVFPREEHFIKPDIYHLSKVAFLEYLTSGITAAFDQYFFPPQSAKAAKEMGFRLNIVGTYNKSYGLEKLLSLFHRYNDEKDGLIKYTLGVHAEYTLPDDEATVMMEVSKITKSPFYTHICETEREVKDCIKRRHMTPVEYFESIGLFENGGGCYHCNFMSDNDIEIFKRHNLSVVTCPGSNTKLASGVAPICKYLDAGLNVALGTDGPASNNCLDMFKEMMLVTSLQKVTLKNPEALPAYEVLKMATVNGAHAMGLDDCDILEVGKKADIIEIDLNRPNMQPINNIVNNIVYSGSKDNIKMTMINGKILYADREFHIRENVQDIYKKCTEVSDGIERRYQESIK